MSPSYAVGFTKIPLFSKAPFRLFSTVCAGGVVLRRTLKRTADIMVTIPEYYEGKNVLITGATGFMGKVQYCFKYAEITDTSDFETTQTQKNTRKANHKL